MTFFHICFPLQNEGIGTIQIAYLNVWQRLQTMMHEINNWIQYYCLWKKTFWINYLYINQLWYTAWSSSAIGNKSHLACLVKMIIPGSKWCQTFSCTRDIGVWIICIWRKSMALSLGQKHSNPMWRSSRAICIPDQINLILQNFY